MIGKKSKKIKAGIFDVGLNRSTPRSRVYSFLKGVLDSGFSVPANKEYLPAENLIIKKQEDEKLIKLIKEKLDKNG